MKDTELMAVLEGIQTALIQLRAALLSERGAARATVEAGRIQIVLWQVADYFGIALEIFPARLRSQSVAWPRAVAMFLLREELGLTLAKTASVFRRDHSAVAHNAAVVQARLDTEPKAREQVTHLRRKIHALLNPPQTTPSA